MFRFLILAGATVLLAALVGGCGGSERLEYERDLAKVGRVVDDSLEQLPGDDAETIGPEEVRSIADHLREAADQLDDLDPPKDAARAQKRLQRGLRGVAKAFDVLAKQLEDATTDSAKAELFVQFATDEQVDTAFDDLIGAQEAYAAEGYRVFGTDTAKRPAAKG
ncbi:MAG: hypothetical protein JWL76_968 [Thermoleophilia bacterium]|nr:hypothetical protein [Thermoleophilia bacterium]